MVKFLALRSLPEYAVLLLLAAGTVSTKAMGGVWFAMLVLGVFYWLKKPTADSLQQVCAESAPVDNIAKGWLICCVLAFALKTVPMVYWSGPWQERHAELRLLLGAMGSYLLLKYQRLPKGWGQGLGHALAIACLLAFGLSAIWGSNSAPTNRIPWAAGVSLLTCLLLSWSFVLPQKPKITGLWRICSLLGVCAVLISGVRGSYLLMLIWPALWWVLTMQVSGAKFMGKFLNAMLAIAIAIAAIALAPSAESPLARTQLIITELGLAGPSKTIDHNSSNGARMVLWKAGINAFQDHWLIGLGFTGGKELIQQTAQASQSEAIKVLGHFHNDYIHTAVEFGLFGLFSFLGYCLGMGWCAWRLYMAGHKTPAFGLLAVLAMHMSSAMTNMNFAHNYYPTVLSLSIGLLLLLPRLQMAPATR